ncbi:MOSC N-terminal beta barrel domain-containing protein [Neohortaea acidophila]|uniref:MOSC N-terminal beta barrel domain-containing protein n=1 Tax=Neohortaea acidophila TaxID=245834 RepID=A0A6A6PSP9_9PEZI|nr:MOSC N-terminal beta barrel domain-containing protein [Neohortaea acidophila]KAF2482711.1 MOSC N-terminal beta barrel domain-containing protein [Neohortaea acidophila]
MDSIKSLFAPVRTVLEKLGILSPQNLWNDILQQHWRVNAVLLIIITALFGWIIMLTLARYIDLAPVKPSDLLDGVVSKPGSPPIPPPTEIVSLRVYPIKSCRGVELQSTRMRRTGLTLDRNWMFVTTSDYKFMTIRGDSSMTLIDTALVEGDDPKDPSNQQLEISIHGGSPDDRIRIPAFPTQEWLKANTTLRPVEIWEQETDGYVYAEKFNTVFSDFFRKEVALVYKGPTKRLNRINGQKDMYGEDIATNFPDVVSLQIANEASITDLNRRLREKHGEELGAALTIERFRPNIIIRGREDHPWEEDTWKRIRITTTLPSENAIYKIELDSIARCARCQVPNVNPDTAEKHAKEPWDELMKFRRVDSGGPAKFKPCFGMLCIPRREGKIAVGAKLEVLETTANHLYSVRKFADL